MSVIIDPAAAAVWKFSLPGARCGIEMPCGARILRAAAEDGTLVVWAAVDPRQPAALRLLVAVNTGGALPAGPKTYVDTVIVDGDGGQVVWHVFELGAVHQPRTAVRNSVTGSVLGSVVQAGQVGGSAAW